MPKKRPLLRLLLIVECKAHGIFIFFLLELLRSFGLGLVGYTSLDLAQHNTYDLTAWKGPTRVFASLQTPPFQF